MTLVNWQQKAQAKQAEAAAKIPAEWRLSPKALQQVSTSNDSVLDIPKTCGLLTPEEVAITENYDATALRDKLAAGELTSVQVTTAFCKRAAIAQQVTCCLTETMFPMALARAKQLDDHLATTGEPIGPLHGLPVSLKETFNVKGIPTTLGFISFLERGPMQSNSALVEILLAAGAVLYVKTNVPQTMMTADSQNNLYGRVLNPHRRNLTAGGSSGGEGALLAMRGSVLGLGTDIAGSVRIPAICCGTFGFKPTVGRVPYGGQTSAARPGMPGIAPCAGPMCHTARDAELLLRIVFNGHADDLDDMATGIPWIEQVPKSRLNIGLLPEDPRVPLHPNMERALSTAAQKLTAAGHNVVDLSGKIPSLGDACDLSFRFFAMDPEKTQLKHVANGGEPYISSLKFTYSLDGSDPEPTLDELFGLNVKRAEVTAKMRQVFLDNQLDVIIGPGYQSCAPPHDTYGRTAYTVLANLIDVCFSLSLSSSSTILTEVVSRLHHSLWQGE